jgi:hypothetical protein
MIHHAIHFQLAPEVDKAALEEMVRTSRSLLLRIPEVLAVRSGRNLDPESRWQFFVALEVDSREKLRAVLDDPFHIKLMERIIKPRTIDSLELDFELDPSKDLKYS